MDRAIQLLLVAALLGSGTIGGIFFAFSSFVMPALGRLPGGQGLAAMQSINVTVLRPSFLGTFMGTAVLSIGAVVLATFRWGEPGAASMAAGGALYIVGTFLVTGLRSVPLNNALEGLGSTEASAVKAWEHYLRRWTLWNHVRTAAALLATVVYSLALLQLGP